MSGLFPETSATLIRELRGGSDAAWGQFVDQYRPGIYRACRAERLDDAVAEDITQIVLLNLVRNMESYAPERGRFRPWLNAVIRNALRDHFSSAWVQRARQVPDEEGTAWQDRIADSIAGELASDERLTVHLAIDRVRSEVRELDWQVFHRRHFVEQSVKEVADALGITTANVAVLDSRFRARLKQLLAEMEEPR
jgi:RNA polymerase sigma-70 factor (ECF subfamily)